ncbi:MAG TPA: iron-containing redox enzyme family protein [Candidatus Dormibacteraeota bacterium]|nr:iron-containing redox enzyme family protein [Candidatus Dormibacteraeota bacterium]
MGTGDLSLDELRDYSCEYAHVVQALPRWLRQAAQATPGSAVELDRHAGEEDGDIGLWGNFAEALGVDTTVLASSKPNPATAELLRRGDELSAQPCGAAVAWALEVQTPAVSVEKLRGLEAYYGITSAGGGEYFDVHSRLDLVHAAELDAVISALGTEHHAVAQRTADEMTDRLWDLLTSVESTS